MNADKICVFIGVDRRLSAAMVFFGFWRCGARQARAASPSRSRLTGQAEQLRRHLGEGQVELRGVGRIHVAADASQLNLAFTQVASQLLRLAR